MHQIAEARLKRWKPANLKDFNLVAKTKAHFLTPKIPLDQKLVDYCLGSLCEDFFQFFFNFFFCTSELHILQAFQEHQAHPIPTPYEFGEVLFKTGIKFIFHVFSEELLHAALWLKLPKG
jgi:hypothetical protein